MHCTRTRYFRLLLGLSLLAGAAGLAAGCGSGGSGSPSGVVRMSLTDAPGSEYDNVFITVRSVWFHLLDTQPYDNLATTGWVRIDLPAPKTIDLLSLRNGNVSQEVLNDALPAGVYRQILLFLAPTEDSVLPSAAALGLQYNNEVDIGGAHYPLRIPDAVQGIRLTGTFPVREEKPLRLVIDVNVGEDVVEIQRNGAPEFLLKPRLQYFDLASVGAVRGTIDPGSALDNTARFVVKAESLNGTDNAYRVIRRVTCIDGTGSYVLYPLRVPGGSSSTTYDVVLRGRDYNTVIVRNVPVVRDTRPGGTGEAAPTAIPEIDLQARRAATADYDASVSVSPTGAWTQFYQTLPPSVDPAGAPYVIRFRHANPLTGRINAFPLSAEDVWWGEYDNSAIVLSNVAPAEGTGGFLAAADAPRYDRSGYQYISPSAPSRSFTLGVSNPPGSHAISGNLLIGLLSGLDNGILFVGHGGIIVDAKPLNAAQVAPGTHPFPILTVPGGTLGLYGVEAFAWEQGGSAFAVGIPRLADVRNTDDTLDISMVGVTP